ncbi:MAG: carbon starvation CstA family protein [candidate division Zixibacteria bacterium]
MNILIPFLGAYLIFWLGYRFYGRYVAERLGEDDSIQTPAKSRNDNKDFIPTRTHILFAHHFSTIAGAGPIIGPTIGILYGFAPAWLWVVLGTVSLEPFMIIRRFSLLSEREVNQSGKSRVFLWEGPACFCFSPLPSL